MPKLQFQGFAYQNMLKSDLVLEQVIKTDIIDFLYCH